VLDGLLHPHNSIPYVQMGRSIALYTVSLLSRDSCERAFIGQLVFLSFSSSWRRLDFVCPSCPEINQKPTNVAALFDLISGIRFCDFVTLK